MKQSKKLINAFAEASRIDGTSVGIPTYRETAIISDTLDALDVLSDNDKAAFAKHYEAEVADFDQQVFNTLQEVSEILNCNNGKLSFGQGEMLILMLQYYSVVSNVLVDAMQDKAPEVAQKIASDLTKYVNEDEYNNCEEMLTVFGGAYRASRSRPNPFE